MRFLLLPALLTLSHLVAAPADTGLLTPSQVSKALSALKENFLRPDALSDAAVERATLDGLIERLAPEVTLATGSAGVGLTAPYYSETCPDRTGYLRPGNLTRENIEKARQALKDWSSHGVNAVVLDLRGTQPSSDFIAAAQLESFFCPKGTEMFTLRIRPGRKIGNDSGSPMVPGVTVSASTGGALYIASADRLFAGLLVVLVDGQTAEAPEAVAASLQKCAKALVVGDKTAGRAFEYLDIPFDGSTLRIAVAQIMLPDGKEPGDTGFKPDIEAALGSTPKSELMRKVTEKGVGSVIQEYDRPHLNEAALVARSNPEVDELEAEELGKKPAASLIDRQLQRAFDLVTSISIYRNKG